MKVILSRKGFDSENGGCPSPILPDGQMVSMPIPYRGDNCRFDELRFPDGRDYLAAVEDLRAKEADVFECHLDPDIRKDARVSVPAGWKPAFGQVNSAEGHLEKQGVKEGDLFLFFGLFRKTEYRNGKLSFVKGSGKIHAIYGWLQIGQMLRGTQVRNLPWHPHSDDGHIYRANGKLTNNTIYVASDRLKLDGKETGWPGAGVFPYAEKRVLTTPGASQFSRWKLTGPFGKVPLSYHYDPTRVHDGYFQSVAKGQEFVFDENPLVTEWIMSLFGF